MPEDTTDNKANVDLPESRHRYLIEHIQDAVVEFEFDGDTPIITDLNNSFVEIFGYERTAVIGEPLNELVVPEWHDTEAERFDRAIIAGEVTQQRVKRKTNSGLREFLYRGIPYRTDNDIEGGFAVYTDLSELNRNEQRFHVLNRVLRHNLRNKTNVIDGHLSELFRELETTAVETIEEEQPLRRAVDDLQQLVEEAHAVRTLIEEPEHETTVIDCVPLIEDAVAVHQQSSPKVTIETALPETLPVRATTKLQAAIESLIDNAIKHNPANAPHVRVRAETAGSNRWVNIYVEDDAPIIPAMEREVITGEADISATNHGSGLGLWLVKWTADICGGELLFGKSELGGNSVQLRLADC